MNEINLDRGERNISRDRVDEIQGRGKSETLKKVGDSTMYRTDESKEDEERSAGDSAWRWW